MKTTSMVTEFGFCKRLYNFFLIHKKHHFLMENIVFICSSVGLLLSLFSPILLHFLSTRDH